jgi:hypothetical protein
MDEDIVIAVQEFVRTRADFLNNISSIPCLGIVIDDTRCETHIPNRDMDLE